MDNKEILECFVRLKEDVNSLEKVYIDENYICDIYLKNVETIINLLKQRKQEESK